MKKTERDIVMIETKRLRHHPDNPRKDLGDVTELADSIKKNGIMQNLSWSVVGIHRIEHLGKEMIT